MSWQAPRHDEDRVDPYVIAFPGIARRKPFGSDGHPVWYALTGGVGTAFGRREFTVFESRRGDVAALGAVGSAVLTYFDCNTAEFRAVLNGNDLRTLRLKRSRPVEVCTALDRGE